MSIFDIIGKTISSVLNPSADNEPRGFRVVDGKSIPDQSVVSEISASQKQTPARQEPIRQTETQPTKVAQPASIFDTISKPISDYLAPKTKQEVQKPISTKPVESILTAFKPEIKPEEKGMLSTEKFQQAYKEGGILGDVKLIGKGIA